MIFTYLLYWIIGFKSVNINTESTRYPSTLIVEAYTYFIGKDKIAFNLKKFLLNFLISTIESLLLISFLYLMFSTSSYEYHHNLNFEIFSTILYAIILFYQIIKLTYFINKYDFTVFIAFF